MLAHWLLSAPPSIQPGSSQTPAIIAVVLALASAGATLFQIWRQSRNDRAINAASHSSAATEASKQSFEQMMATVDYQARRINEEAARAQAAEARVDQLEEIVDSKNREIERLQTLIFHLGGKP